MRSAHKQTCPVFRNTASATPRTVSSKSQSENTIAAFFPPSSNDTGFTVAATAFMIAAPVRDSPVNVTAFTSGFCVRNSPDESAPKPCTTLYTPLGIPASFIASASRVAVAGVSSEGFTTTVFPQASAGATFQVSSNSGRFQGVIIPTTPSGFWAAKINPPPPLAGSRLKRFDPRHFDPVGEHSEVGCRARNVKLRGQGNRLSCVRHFRLQKAIEPGFNRVRNFVQMCRPLAHPDATPFSEQGFAGGLHRVVHQVLICFGHFRDHVTVGWIHVREFALAAHKLPVDVVLD